MNPAPPGLPVAPEKIHPAPSLLTLCNAFCGFASLIIVLGRSGQGTTPPQACIWLLLGSMVFDALDGLAARWLNAKSRLGAQLDSMADALSFGVAPAAIVFASASRSSGDDPKRLGLVLCASFFYLGCALWRLARFNTRTPEAEKKAGRFTGLPSPAAASLVYSAGWLLPGLPPSDPWRFPGLLGFTILIGLLMVSRVPYPHAYRCFPSGAPVLRAVWIAVILGSVAVFRIPAMIAWACLYLLLAPLLELRAARKSLPREAAEEPAGVLSA